MPRHHSNKPSPWSKLKSRIEPLFDRELPLAIHRNVYLKLTRHWKLDEPRHWVVLGYGRAHATI